MERQSAQNKYDNFKKYCKELSALESKNYYKMEGIALETVCYVELQTNRPKYHSTEMRNKLKMCGTLVCNRYSTINPRGNNEIS